MDHRSRLLALFSSLALCLALLPAGAQEVVAAGPPVYYLSVNSSTSLPGVDGVSDEDIVVYDTASGTWAMFFDASDVGVDSGGLDAFHIREDGSILMSASTNGRFKVPGLVGGPERDFVDDSDILLFTPTSTGEVTVGLFSFFFDGSDVGLDHHGEDIDGVLEFPDGSLGISVVGDYTVAGLPSGGPEDVLRFTGSFGADTTGMWGLHFDGSDVGFDASVSLNGIFQATDLYFTTEPGYDTAGGSGSDDDVSRFAGTFGDPTTGTAALHFSPSTVGLDPSLVVDGLHVDNAGGGGSTNSAPVASNDSFSTNEDTTLNVAAPGVLGNDSDPDGDALTAILNTDVSNGSLTLNSDGSFSYTPDPDFNGTDSFTYDASDGLVADPATVTITVNPVNDAPVAADDWFGVDEGGTLDVGAPGVLGNDSDVDGDSLAVSLDTGVSSGSLTLNPDGSFSYTPDPGFTGSDSFTYNSSDGSLSDTATVTITVNAVNDAPVAVDDAFSVDEDGTLSVAAPGVLMNDSDADGDILLAAVSTGASNGSLTLNPDGSFSYIPDPNFNGTDTFTYNSSDGSLSDTATVTITVDPVNDAPIAFDDAYSGTEETTLAITGPGVLGNDTDVDGDTLTAVLNTGVYNGSLTLNSDGSFSYTPNPGFSGVDSFTYDASDGTLVHTATVTITIDPANDAPVAVDDAYNTDEDVTLDAVAPGVLGNDSDPDGNTLTAILKTDVSDGSLTLNPDGSFLYSPDPDFSGVDSFTYDASDGLSVGTATVTITVGPVNDAPVSVDDSYGTDQDTLLGVSAPGVLGNDSDVDGDVLTAALNTGASNGSLTLNADGSFSYTPDPGFTGSDSFAYSVSDGVLSDTATVTITVDPVNTQPVAVDDSVSTAEDTPVVVDVLANDSDPDGDTLSLLSVAQPSDGFVVVNPDDTVTYTPDADFNGTDSFTYTVSDGSSTDTATVLAVVAPVNDAPVAVDDSHGTDQDTLLDVAAPGVLGNDLDPDGDALSATLKADVSTGSLTLNSDGSFSYTPDPGFSGTDSFTYDVSDGLSVDTATVTITVDPVTAIGFGAAATGGSTPCVVTSLANSGAGSLRECAEAGGNYVTFAVSGAITLLDDIDVEPNTTINGFGQDVTVVGMLDVKRVYNVIIRHLTVTGSDRDAIRVIDSHTLWFDHLELSNSVDGLIDITNGSTDVTISWSHFHSHDKMVLVNPGKRTSVTARVTLHHNWFDNGGRRYPSAEGSDVHGFNNFYDGWTNYGVSITEGARFLSENNVYRASTSEKGLITNVPGEVPGEAVSIGDIIEGDVVLEVQGSAFTPTYSYTLDAASNVISIVTTGVGPNN